MLDLNFYKDKTVLVTGHTGFKGTWLCKMLLSAGAKVIGYALNPPTDPNLFVLSGIESRMVSVIGDIRDFRALNEVLTGISLNAFCIWRLSLWSGIPTRCPNTRTKPMYSARSTFSNA